MSTKNLIQSSQEAMEKYPFLFHGAQILHQLCFLFLTSRYMNKMLQMWCWLSLDVLQIMLFLYWAQLYH